MESPKKLVKAGKRVGITGKGLSVKWMDQAMFEQAAAVLNPGIPTKTSADLPGVISPEGVPKLRIVLLTGNQSTLKLRNNIPQDSN